MEDDADLREAFGAPPSGQPQVPMSSVEPAGVDDLREAFARGSSTQTARSAPPTTAREIGRERGRQQGQGGLGAQIAAPFMATGQAMGRSMYGNLMDYPVAATYGLLGAARGEGFSEPYTRAIEDMRGYREGLLENRPIENIGGGLMGSIPGALVASRAVTAAQALPSMVGNWWNRLGSVGQSTVAGAGLGAAQGAAEGEGLEDRGRRGLQGAIVGGVGGAGTETAIRAGSGGWRRMFGADPTPAAGVSPQARADMFAREGVSPTMGQLTGGLRQQQFEEAARHGGYGTGAQRILEEHARRQAEQLRARQSQLIDDVGGTGVPGQTIQDGLRTVDRRYQELGNIGYDNVRRSDAGITMDGVRQIQDIPARVLDRMGITYDPMKIASLPKTDQAINIINRVIGSAEDQLAAMGPALNPTGMPPGSVQVPGTLAATPTIPFRVINELRQELNNPRTFGRALGETPDDLALAGIRRGLLDWMDQVAGTPAFRGDPQVVQTLRQANADWRRHLDFQHPNPRAADADAQAAISRLVTRDLTPEEQAALVASSSGVGTSGKSSRIQPHLERILGRDYPAVRETRSDYLDRALFPRGAGSPENPGSARQLSGLRTAFETAGAPTARTMYTPGERAMIGEHRDMLRAVAPRPEATNPSRTSLQQRARYAAMHPMVAAGLAAAGFTQSGTTGLALGALPTLYQMAAAQRARAAVAPRLGAPSLTLPRTLGYGADAAVRDTLDILQD